MRQALGRLFFTLLLAAVPTILMAALPATEICDGSFPSASWTDHSTTFVVGNTGGNCYNTIGNWGGAFWNADTFGNDQYAEITWGVTDPTYAGPGVRMSGQDGARNGYALFGDTGTMYLRKWTSGTESGDLQTWTQSCCTVGDTYRLEIVGTTLTAYYNGTPLSPTVTDSSIASGSAGMFMYGSSARIDDWEGGNIGGAVSTCRGSMLLGMIGC